MDAFYDQIKPFYENACFLILKLSHVSALYEAQQTKHQQHLIHFH